jgi:tetratricopeptide (TPR) repeat protein
LNEILAWFAGQILTPTLVDQARRLLSKRSWQTTLAKRVNQRTEIAFPRRRLRKWLRRVETANTLVSPSQEDLEELRDSLAEALWPEEAQSEARPMAEEVLARIVSEFLFALKTVDAVAISHYRQAQALADVQDQTKTIIGLLSQEQGFAEVLDMLPPNVRGPLVNLAKKSATAARDLIAALHQPEDPARAVEDLTSKPPDWLLTAPFEAWVATAEFAAAHRVEDVAVTAFQHLAEFGAPNRTLWLGRAALQIADENPTLARALLEQARQMSDAPHTLVQLVEYVLKEDWENVRQASDQMLAEHPGERIIALALRASAESALRMWDKAIETCDQVLELEPLHSSIALHKARVLVARVQASRSESREGDLFDAYRLSLRARDSRRLWKGPSPEATDLACQIAVLRGDWEAVIRLGTSPPLGEADRSEQDDDAVRAKVVAAAITIGQLDVAREQLPRIDDPFEKAFLSALLNEKLDTDPTELRSQYHHAYSQATTEEQRTAVRQALAFLGESPVPGVSDQGADNPEEIDLILATSEAARGDLPSAVRRLRRWSPNSPKAVNLLALLLGQAGDTTEAVDVLKEGYSRFNDAALLSRAVELLGNADRAEEGEPLAQESLGVTSGAAKRRLREMIITFASGRGAWNEVEKQCRALIEEGDQRPRMRWALALSLFNQGKRAESWDVVSRPPTLEPVEDIHAQLYIQLQREFGRGSDAIARILNVAKRFRDSETVSAAALMAAMQLGAEVEVPDSVAQEVSEASAAFFDQFPESEFLARYEFSTPENFSEQVRELFPQAAERETEITRVVHQVSLEGYPYGMLSALARRPYSEALLRRAAGCLPIVSPDDRVVAAEYALAAEHLNTVSSIDPSVLHTLSLTPDLWTRVRTEFRNFVISQFALRDLLIARDSLILRSTGTLSWDPTQERVRLTEITKEQAEDLASRSEWMAGAATSLQTDTSSPLRNFPELDEDGFAPWLAGLDSAKEEGRPLFCDDVGLRNLARSMDVPTFGSLSVLQVMREAGRVESAELEAMLLTLVRTYAVDLHPDLSRMREAARADTWEPRGAAFAITRPKFWTESGAPSIYQDLLREAGEAAPDQLAGWVFAAVTGSVRAAREDVRKDVAASVLAFSLLETGIPTGRVPLFIIAAREATNELGVGDPLESAIVKVSQLLDQKYGPEMGAKVLLGSVAALPDQDRYVVMRALLSRGGLLVTPDMV